MDLTTRSTFSSAASTPTLPTGEGGFKVFDIAQLNQKGFSEKIVSAPVSPLGQGTNVKTRFATAVSAPTTLAVDPARLRLPENEEQPIHLLYAFIYITDREEGLVVSTAATLLDGNPTNNFLDRAVAFNPDGILDGAVNLAIAGRHAYILCDRGLVIVDIDDPLNPRVVSEIGAPQIRGPRAIAIQFRYAFVADADGVKIVDVTFPQEPRLVQGATVPLDDARGIYVARTYAYVAAGAAGLVIIDIEKPEQPFVDQTFNAAGAINDAYDVKVAMTNASVFAYVADGHNGLRVLQLVAANDTARAFGFSPRPAPELVASYHTHGPALSVSEGLDRDRACGRERQPAGGVRPPRRPSFQSRRDATSLPARRRGLDGQRSTSGSMTAARRPRCKITFHPGSDSKVSEVVVSKSPFVLGRAYEADLVMTDGSVSREHARLEYVDDDWTIVDLDSSNGIALNSEPTRRAALTDGDVITVGTVDVTFNIIKSGGDTRIVVDVDEARAIADPVTELQVANFNLLATEPAVAVPTPETEATGAEREGSGWLIELIERATEVVIASEDVDGMLERFVDLALETLPARRAAICLYDAELDAVVPKAARAADGDDDAEVIISQTIADEVLKNEKSLLFEDISKVERFAEAESILFTKPQSVICAPLFHDGKTSGLIYLDTQTDFAAFNESDLRVLTTLGLLAGVGLQQASLRDLIETERRNRTRLERYHSPQRRRSHPYGHHHDRRGHGRRRTGGLGVVRRPAPIHGVLRSAAGA